jgi:hypothetical protein
MTIVVMARSSSQPEPYSVTFSTDDKLLAIRCACPAGELSQLCKHKLALLQGDESILFDSSQRDQLTTALGWVRSTSIPSLLDELKQAEKTSEQQISHAKKTLSAVKHRIGRLLTEGVK